VMARVLPVPAPARTTIGPVGSAATARCSGSRAARIVSADGGPAPVRASRAFDDYGHGTHVAGLIAGTGMASGGEYRGLAPNVRLVALKVLDASGAGLTTNVIRAIDFAVANRVRLGIDVINLSLGSSSEFTPMRDAIDYAVAMLKGEDVPERVILKPTKITKENAEEWYAKATVE